MNRRLDLPALLLGMVILALGPALARAHAPSLWAVRGFFSAEQTPTMVPGALEALW